MAKTIQQNISFSEEMFRMAKYRSQMLGLNFNEYVRHVLANDLMKIAEADMLKYDVDTISKVVQEAKNEHKEGKTIKIEDWDKEFEDIRNAAK